jgi:hypothetical protein
VAFEIYATLADPLGPLQDTDQLGGVGVPHASVPIGVQCWWRETIYPVTIVLLHISKIIYGFLHLVTRIPGCICVSEQLILRQELSASNPLV